MSPVVTNTNELESLPSMRSQPQLPDAQVFDLLDTLSVQQEEATAALTRADDIDSQWTFANYLDTAVMFPQEKRSKLYRSIVLAVSNFIEARLHDTPAVADLAQQSWVYGELVEAELQKDELELTLDHEAIPFEAVEVLTRVAALSYCETA